MDSSLSFTEFCTEPMVSNQNQTFHESYENDIDHPDDDDNDNWEIPPPTPQNEQHKPTHRFSSSTTLLRSSQRTSPSSNSRENSFLSPTNFLNSAFRRHQSPGKETTSRVNTNEVLWGENNLEANNDSPQKEIRIFKTVTKYASKLSTFFFGFMYEEPQTFPYEYYRRTEDPQVPLCSPNAWNSLNLALFSAYLLTTIATTAPVIIIPAISETFGAGQSTAFTSRAVASSVLGTSCGKFINGLMGDVFGARRTLSLYSFLLSLSLVTLSVSQTPSHILWACFLVEFCQSVQWPCILTILASHYNSRRRTFHEYENAIYILSIAARVGSLFGIPTYSFLLRRIYWRLVAMIGAWAAIVASSIYFLHVQDSPENVDEPKNPLDDTLLRRIASVDIRKRPSSFLFMLPSIINSFVRNNLAPSLSKVLKSGVFWVFSLAHTGSSMIRTSDRMLGSYFYNTSSETLTEDRAAELAAFLSFGNVLGLLIGGKLIANQTERQRKLVVSRMYMITIASVYVLAALGHPWVRYLLYDPGFILFLQVLASFTMGFGISVMLYILPGLVGLMFGKNTGLFAAYTDGVSYALASLVWRIVGHAVENGATGGSGWAYGWASVALLIILCAVLMLEFLEHYFVRPNNKFNNSYETIILA